MPARIVGTDGKSYRKEPAEPPAFQSREAITARRDRIREMAAGGFRCSQIAAEVGMTEGGVKNACREMGVDVVADRVVGRVRRLDSNRIINEAAIALEATAMGLNLVEWDAIDTEQVDGWVVSFRTSLASLNAFMKQLKETNL